MSHWGNIRGAIEEGSPRTKTEDSAGKTSADDADA